MTRTLRHTIASIILAAAALLGIASMPASAEFYADDKNATDPARPQIEALAKEFAAYPAAFDCELAWGQMTDPGSVSMEFVPKGHDVRKWTRLVTIQTLGLPAKDADRKAMVKRLQGLMLASYSQQGNVIDTKEGIDANGAPTLFIEYEVGKGAAKEHNAAAIMKLRADLAGIVQIQSRGKPLAREDAAKMKALAIPATKN